MGINLARLRITVLLPPAIFLFVLFLLPIFEGGNGSYGMLIGISGLSLIFLLHFLMGELRPSQYSMAVLIAIVALLLFTTTYLYPTLKVLLYLVSGILAFVLTVHYSRRFSNFALLFLETISISALVLSLYGIFLISANFPRITFETHLKSTFGLHNSFAGFLLLTWPVAWAVAIVKRHLLYSVIGLILPVTLLLTFSRASYIAFAFQLLYILIAFVLHWRAGSSTSSGEPSSVSREGGRFTYWFLPLLLVSIGAVALAFTTFYSSLWTRISSIFNFLDYSLQGRLTFWKIALMMFARFPLTGVGLGNFGYHFTYLQPNWHYYAKDAHGIIFQALAEAGILGVLILILGVALYLRLFVKAKICPQPFTPNQRILLLSALLGFFLHVQVDFDLTYLANVLYFSALLAILVFGALNYERFERRSVRSIFTLIGLSRNVIAFVAILGLLTSSFLGYLFFKERSYVDVARNVEKPKAYLESALKAMPINASIRIELALLNLNNPPFDERELERNLRTVLLQNPFESQGYFLMSQISTLPLEERIRLGEKAIQLDPFNRPYYYLGLSRLYRMFGDEVNERRILLLFYARYRDITGRITPDFPRPLWISYNPTFRQIYLRLGEIMKDEDASASKQFLLRARAFEVR